MGEVCRSTRGRSFLQCSISSGLGERTVTRVGCVCVCVLVAKLCLTLCDPMDCSLPGYRNSADGILQARILEWVAVSFSTRVGWGIVMRWWRFPLLTPIFCASRYHVPEANDGETWGSQDPPGAKEINHGGIQWPWGDFQLL